MLIEIGFCGIFFAFAIALNSVGSAIFLSQSTFHSSATLAALLEVFEDGGIVVASLVAASFVFRVHFVYALAVASTLVAAGCFFLPFVAQFWFVFLVFVIIGGCFAVSKMVVLGALRSVLGHGGAEQVKAEKQARFMNVLEACFMSGIVCNYFLFSLFTQNDSNNQGKQWLRVYFVVATLSIISSVVLIVAVMQSRHDTSEESSSFYPRSIVGTLRRMSFLFRKPLVLSYGLSIFLYILVEQSVMTWLPSYNAKILMLSATLSIQISSLMAAFTAIGRLVFAFAVKYVSWLKLLCACILGGTLMSIVVVSLSLQQTYTTISDSWGAAPWPAFVLPMLGFFLAPVCPLLNSHILEKVPDEDQGVMSALIIIFSAAGGATGSLATGYLFQTIGGKYAFFILPGPMMLMLVSIFVLDKQSYIRTNDIPLDELN